MSDEALTSAELDRLEKICEAATRGPFFSEPCDSEAFVEVAVVESDVYEAVEIYAPRDGFVDDPAATADLFSTACTALPACVSQLRRVREVLQDRLDPDTQMGRDIYAELGWQIGPDGKLV